MYTLDYNNLVVIQTGPIRYIYQKPYHRRKGIKTKFAYKQNPITVVMSRKKKLQKENNRFGHGE